MSYQTSYLKSYRTSYRTSYRFFFRTFYHMRFLNIPADVLPNTRWNVLSNVISNVRWNAVRFVDVLLHGGFSSGCFFYRILDETSYRTFHRMVCQLFHWKIHRMFSAGQVCDDVPQSDTCDQTPPSDTPPSDTTPVNSAGAVQTFLTHLSHPCQTTYGLMKHLTRRHISC